MNIDQRATYPPGLHDIVQIRTGGPGWGWQATGCVTNIDHQNGEYRVVWLPNQLMVSAGDHEWFQVNQKPADPDGYFACEIIERGQR